MATGESGRAHLSSAGGEGLLLLLQEEREERMDWKLNNESQDEGTEGMTSRRGDLSLESNTMSSRNQWVLLAAIHCDIDLYELPSQKVFVESVVLSSIVNNHPSSALPSSHCCHRDPGKHSPSLHLEHPLSWRAAQTGIFPATHRKK
ncbi:hypothetical protein CDAR_580361 [Caerostris darwini]|uniref:Uncharacterized protein n=1 Tax=Caerostris darwini TaxID=1538125 RepID=A0AAV4RCV8_9ARAC|nr:hypothetical protein CDAR_580361 [Caerostris darwini]